MKTFTTALLLILTLSNCKNNTEIIPNETECIKTMIERFRDEIKCSEKGNNETNLYSGTYEKKKIYFTDTMCINCNTVPPTYGYTCDGRKITITDFTKKVTDIKEVYNSCTLE